MSLAKENVYSIDFENEAKKKKLKGFMQKMKQFLSFIERSRGIVNGRFYQFGKIIPLFVVISSEADWLLVQTSDAINSQSKVGSRGLFRLIEQVEEVLTFLDQVNPDDLSGTIYLDVVEMEIDLNRWLRYMKRTIQRLSPWLS